MDSLQTQYITALDTNCVASMDDISAFYYLDKNGVRIYFNGTCDTVSLAIRKGDKEMADVFSEVAAWLAQKADALKAISSSAPIEKNRKRVKRQATIRDRFILCITKDGFYRVDVESANGYYSVSIMAFAAFGRLSAHNITDNIEGAISILMDFSAFSEKIAQLIMKDDGHEQR